MPAIVHAHPITLANGSIVLSILLFAERGQVKHPPWLLDSSFLRPQLHDLSFTQSRISFLHFLSRALVAIHFFNSFSRFKSLADFTMYATTRDHHVSDGQYEYDPTFGGDLFDFNAFSDGVIDPAFENDTDIARMLNDHFDADFASGYGLETPPTPSTATPEPAVYAPIHALVAESIPATPRNASMSPRRFAPGSSVEGLPTPATSAPSTPPRAPIYAHFAQRFADSAAAAAHRAKPRMEPIPKDRTFDSIKSNPEFWVESLHDAMLNTSDVLDGTTSQGWKRFVEAPAKKSGPVYEDDDIEAAAWEVFDTFIALYERGLNLPKRLDNRDGKFPEPGSAHDRIEQICDTLKIWKSTCVDVMDGGWKLQKLVLNPNACCGVKAGNCKSNLEKAELLKAGQEARGTSKKRKRDD